MRHLFPALVLLLTGCGGPVITHIQNDDRLLVDSLYRYDAADGEVAVEVHGGPAGVDPARYAAAVAAAVEAPFWLPPARFRPVAAGAAEFRMVLLVDAPVSAGGSQACQAPGRVALSPAPGALRVQGAMCYRGRALTSATGSLDPAPQGPQDPRFRALLQQLTWTLLPQESRDDDVMALLP